MEWLIIPIVIVMGMIGGQKFKAIRRYGIPITSLSVGLKKKKWKTAVLVLLSLVLSMGYGENSKLSKLLGNRDWLVRLVYGLLLGIILAIFGFVWSIVILPIAWLVRIPYSFKIGKYDWLWEDFVRYGALGICIWRYLA